ncbi:HlyD family type I secretion periplasmic adaptor subunit [Tabrizicola sp.]|uniref:HlyD family type I secretion periplasmic adaptor subunit n=1 Tax=Tabrizicola sp. TaxID=2005166 RepID=UPI002733DF57|nr:HlyD family type I secretion periplasmic adaptor subunit [Tabrizicola sp.]MDP3198068.1 HlyD family type I secretion periplasmic adaptor subunit [Tabrizicola sp.]
MSGVLSIRGPVILGLAAFVALVLVLGLWGTTARIAGAVIAQGQIEVERDRQIVQHPEGGVVEAILVVEGERVSAGDPLIRLDGAALQSELVIVDGRLSALSSQAARLEAERDGSAVVEFAADLLALAATTPAVAAQLDGQRRLFEARRTTLDEARTLLLRRIDQIAAQSGGLLAQSGAVRTQLEFVEQELAVQRGLRAKGLARAGPLLSLEREKARLSGQLGALEAELARSDGQITETEMQVSGLASTRREAATTELRDIEAQMLELAERRRALAERINRLEIRAPVSGIVLGLQVTTPRAVLRAGEPVLYLVPQDRPLVITARIAPIHINEVIVGQAAELVFPAFSSRTTPHLQGTVVMVSADALRDPATGTQYYRAELELNAGEATRLGDQVLLPGMPVDVFLQTGDRTPLAYLVKPFTDYLGRAFRES